MELTDKQREALREVVRCKLRLWDAASLAESIVGREVDTGEELAELCAHLGEVKDVDTLVTDGDLIELLGNSME